MSTGILDALLLAATNRLRSAGVDAPQREARLLLAHTLGVKPLDIIAGTISSVSEQELYAFEAFLARRISREPLAYITGSREFWSLDFAVGPGVLVPRPESELLVEEALRRFPSPDQPLRVLDLGTGTGCLLLAFLSERPNAQGTGIDRSSAALKFAKQNARALGLAERTRFIEGDWAGGVLDNFDLIFANPPYISGDDLMDLPPEILRYEPRAALDGGPDGLDAYRSIAQNLTTFIAPGGFMVLELGRGQAENVKEIFTAYGFEFDSLTPDLAGIPRCLTICATGKSRVQKKELAMGA